MISIGMLQTFYDYLDLIELHSLQKVRESIIYVEKETDAKSYKRAYSKTDPTMIATERKVNLWFNLKKGNFSDALVDCMWFEKNYSLDFRQVIRIMNDDERQ